MACKNVEFSIETRDYRMQEWSAEQGLEMFLRFTKYVGNVFGSAISIDSKTDKFNFNSKEFGAAMLQISVPEVKKLIQDMVKDVFYIATRDSESEYDREHKGLKIDFNAHFSEYKADLIPMLMTVFKIQFSPFVPAHFGLSFFRPQMARK
jgi:hypothetical protein